jgi:hypothetical protein
MITREEFINSVPIDPENAGMCYNELVENFGSNSEQVENHLNTIIEGMSHIVPPSQELYNCMIGNLMTLGRTVPTFSEYVDDYMLGEVARLFRKITRRGIVFLGR